MRRIITLDPHSERPVSVSLLEDRVIQTELLGVPVELHLTDIVHLTDNGIFCQTKLRNIKLLILQPQPDPQFIYGVFNTTYTKLK